VQIARNKLETTTGPSEWFTGAVFLDTVTTPSGPSRLNASSVHFTPGARTVWHTHPNGQTLYVTEGVGLAQGRGARIEVIRPGDRVFFEPRRGTLARRGRQPLHDAPVDGRGRRRGQQRDMGRACDRPGVRVGATHRQLSQWRTLM
jgi:hypothetical protein